MADKQKEIERASKILNQLEDMLETLKKKVENEENKKKGYTWTKEETQEK